MTADQLRDRRGVLQRIDAHAVIVAQSMFLLRRPPPALLDRVLRDAGRLTLSYGPPGIARGVAPDGFRAAEERRVIAHGRDAFARAVRALQEWRQFDLGWVSIYPTNAALATGTNVLVVARHLGFWSVNACRVVYQFGDAGLDECWGEGAGERQSPRLAGFAYGTLTEHAEAGEEIFQVSFDPTSGEVSYVIRAASRERALLAKLGFPIARALQGRFRRESAAAMRRHVAETAE